MIELRWYQPSRLSDDNPSRPLTAKPVLQYRQWLVRIDASGAITPLPAPIEWSEWQDIPLIKEGDD